ncbi:MAG TPA: hypothetical protein VM737_02350 [Gemmatimonadota bacterium]|nr:hypothetical protein [Gemmatimonadota bacterium]
MSGTRLAIAGGALAFVLLFLFALYNRGQSLALDFGLWQWRGEAITALYAGICAGLLSMFLFGLPADLAARGERERLARRVRQLERERESDLRREPDLPREAEFRSES